MNLPQKTDTGGDYIMGKMDTRAILIFLGIGLVAGFLAGLIVGGGNILLYLIWGIVGSFVGGFLGYALFNSDADEGALQAGGIIGSVIGAIIALLVYRMVRSRSSVA